MTGRWARGLGRGLAVVGVLLVLVSVRVVISSRAELTEASRLSASGDVDAAIVHYRRAVRWYAPGSPYPTEALTALAAIGAEAEEADDPERALSAYRAIRGGILATRSFYVPHEAQLAAANARIAELMAGQPAPPIDAGKTRAELRDEHLALLATPTRPRMGWTLLLLLGFALWVASAFAFAVRAVDEEDRLVQPQATRLGGAFALGFALFVVGLMFA